MEMHTNAAAAKPTGRPKVTRSVTSQAGFPSISRTDTNQTHSTHQSKKHHLDFLHHHHGHKRAEDKSSTVPAPSNHSHHLHRSHITNHPTAAVEKVINKATGTKSGETSRVGSRPSSTPLSERNGLAPVRRKVVRPEDVIREKELSKERDEELRLSLNELSELAHSATRRLDGTYYSLLEKIETLRTTIGMLQELFSASSKTHNDFKVEIGELEEEIKGQVNIFGGFEGQQNRIEELEQRIKAGQSKTTSLSERLEAARKRVEVWEHRENEWQTKTSKRLKLFWIGLIVLASLIILIVLLRRSSRFMSEDPVDIDALRHVLENTSIPAFAVDDLAQIVSSRLQSTDPSKSSRTAIPSDGRLKLFDEL